MLTELKNYEGLSSVAATLEFEGNVQKMVQMGMPSSVVRCLYVCSALDDEPRESDWLESYAQIVVESLELLADNKPGLEFDEQDLLLKKDKDLGQNLLEYEASGCEFCKCLEALVPIVTRENEAYSLEFADSDEEICFVPGAGVRSYHSMYNESGLARAGALWWNFNLLAFAMYYARGAFNFLETQKNIRKFCNWGTRSRSALLSLEGDVFYEAIGKLADILQFYKGIRPVREAFQSMAAWVRDAKDFVAEATAAMEKYAEELTSKRPGLFETFIDMTDEEMEKFLADVDDKAELLEPGAGGKQTARENSTANRARERKVIRGRLVPLFLATKYEWHGTMTKGVRLNEKTKRREPYFCASFVKNGKLCVLAECAETENASYLLVTDDINTQWKDIFCDKDSARAYGVKRIYHADEKNHWKKLVAEVDRLTS